MSVLRPGVMPVILVALVLGGCAGTTTAPDTPDAAGPSADTGIPADALVGTYSVEFQTTESDHDAITDETVVRDGEVTGSCSGSDCDLAFTIEVKGPDGSTVSGTTALTFDGESYSGSQTALFSCDGLTTLTTVEGGLEYASDTTITPAATAEKDGTVVVESFDIVTVEHNEITAAGRDAGCLKINFSGPDPFTTDDTTVGVGTRTA